MWRVVSVRYLGLSMSLLEEANLASEVVCRNTKKNACAVKQQTNFLDEVGLL